MIAPVEFDAIYSLGYNCQVASQLRRNQLRHAAGPWDWFNLASTRKFCEVLRNQLSGFMLRENLEVYGKSVNCYYVRDTHTSCLSFHDFKNDPNEKPLYDYPVFRERLDRRIERFNRCLNSNQVTLLIRIIPDEKDAITIDQAIRKTYSNPNISLLFIILHNASHIEHLPSYSEQVHLVKMPKGATWEGDIHAWKLVTQGWSLRE